MQFAGLPSFQLLSLLLPPVSSVGRGKSNVVGGGGGGGGEKARRNLSVERSPSIEWWSSLPVGTHLQLFASKSHA
jgi:hypothetical protein